MGWIRHWRIKEFVDSQKPNQNEMGKEHWGTNIGEQLINRKEIAVSKKFDMHTIYKEFNHDICTLKLH